MIKFLTLAMVTLLASAVQAQTCVKSFRSLSPCNSTTSRYGLITCASGLQIPVYNTSFTCTTEAALTQLGEQRCAQYNQCTAQPVYGGGGGAGGYVPASYSTTFVSVPSSIQILNGVATILYSDSHCSSTTGYFEIFNRKLNLDLSIPANTNFAHTLAAAFSTRSRSFEGLSISCPSAPTTTNYSFYDGINTGRTDYLFPARCTVTALNATPTRPNVRCYLP